VVGRPLTGVRSLVRDGGKQVDLEVEGVRRSYDVSTSGLRCWVDSRWAPRRS
jgi:hypothetical protein